MIRSFTTAVVRADQRALNQYVTRSSKEKESMIKIFLSLELIREAYENLKGLLEHTPVCLENVLSFVPVTLTSWS